MGRKYSKSSPKEGGFPNLHGSDTKYKISTYHPCTFCYEQHKTHDLRTCSATFAVMRPPPVVTVGTFSTTNGITSSAEFHRKQCVQYVTTATTPPPCLQIFKGFQAIKRPTHFYLYSNSARTVANTFSIQIKNNSKPHSFRFKTPPRTSYLTTLPTCGVNADIGSCMNVHKNTTPLVLAEIVSTKELPSQTFSSQCSLHRQRTQEQGDFGGQNFHTTAGLQTATSTN